MMNKITIVYRVCDSVDMLHTVDENDLNNKRQSSMESRYSDRYYNVPKNHLIKKCLLTLNNNLRELEKLDEKNKIPYEFICIHDKCSDDILSFIKNIIPETKFIKTNGEGNGDSFATCIDFASKIIDDDTVVFMLEDDYLFLGNDVLIKVVHALKQITEINKGNECAIFTDDYPDRYADGNTIGINENTDVVITSIGHFMRIRSCTCSFIAYANTIRNHKDTFMKFKEYPNVLEKESTDLVWKDVKLYSPLPALTIHSQHEQHIPFYINKEQIKNYFESPI